MIGWLKSKLLDFFPGIVVAVVIAVVAITDTYLPQDHGEVGSPRSDKWPAVRAEHLHIEPTCAVCGGTEQLQVHHIIPFSQDAGLELCQLNLVTLCEKNRCHFVFGHLCNWRSWNEHIREDAHHMNNRIRNRP